MGLPGAGKSTVKRRRLQPGTLDIEADRIKLRHPHFSSDMGEETDEEVHRWSVRRAVDAFDDAVAAHKPRDLVFDSSGSNARWLKQRISDAKRQGFTTELLWVDVPVEIALLRNRDRAARRGQWCPEEVILGKAKVLRESFEELQHEVDSVEVLENWSPRSDELEVAQLDLHLYPAPRRKPPSLRPGDRHYGEGPPGARSPSRTPGSRRTLRVGPWKRNEEVMQRKAERIAWMDRRYKGDRAAFISEEVMGCREVLLEPNKFPYQMPTGAEHWTIWSRKPMCHEELCEWIEAWLKAREPHNIVSWNYDDNRGMRTIDLWHVHIYFQGRDGEHPFLSGGAKHVSQPRRRTPSLASLPTTAPSSMNSGRWARSMSS